jgi:hypothetical protein
MAACHDTHRNEPPAIASARKGANAAQFTKQQTIEMDQSPEQAKDNARAMKLPAISLRTLRRKESVGRSRS